MATDRRRAAATTLTGAALLSAGGGLRHEGVRRAVNGGTYPRVHLTALKGAKRGKGLYLAGTAVGTVGAAALGSGLLNLTRRKDVDKADRFVWSQARDDEPESKSYFRGRDTIPVEARLPSKGNVGRKGRMITAQSHEVRPSPGQTRRGGAMVHDKMPIFGGRKWAAGVQADLEYAVRQTRHQMPIKDITGEIMQARRGYFAPRLGLAGAGVGVAAYATGRRRVKKRDKAPLWQEGVAGTADALRDRKASLTTSAPPKARGTQLAVAGGSAAVGSALARLAMRHSSGRTKALVTPIAGALAATASVPLSSRAVQRSTKGEYVVTPTGVQRAKDVIKKPSTKAHMVSSRHGPLRSQVVPSDDRFGKVDSFGVQRAKITAAGSTPLVGPYAQAHLAAHYAPQGMKRKAALRQFAMGPAAGMAAGVGGAYGAAALARHHTGVGTKAESALQWRSDKVNAVRNKIGLGDSKPLAETSLRGRALLRAKANRLAAPIMHNRGTAAAAAVGFLGTRALVSGIGGQAAISLNQRDQRVHKLDIGGRREAKREKHKLADTKRLNADLATASGATNLASLGLLASRHKAKAIPLSIIGSGIGGTNALIGAHVQRREAHAIDPVKKAFPRVAQAVHSAGLDVTDAGARKLSGIKGAYATFRAVPAAKYRRDGTVARRHAKASRLNAGSVVAGLAAPRTDPAALATAALATKVGSRVGDAGWKLGELPTRQERLSAKGGAKHGAHDWRFGNDKPGSKPRRREYPITSEQDKPNWDGTFGKSYLPELPLGNIPREAIHKTHGKVRVLAYHGDNRFTVLARGDQKVLAHREHLTFVKKSFAPVRKSFVNGGVKRAINLTAAERAAVRARAGTGARGPLESRGAPASAGEHNRGLSDLRALNAQAKPSARRRVSFGPGVDEATQSRVLAALPRKVRRPVAVHDARPHFAPTTQMTFGRGASNQPSSMFIHPDTPAGVVRHEFTHSQPRRNYDRLTRLKQNPAGLMREEGRADALAARSGTVGPKAETDYEVHSALAASARRGNTRAGEALGQIGADTQHLGEYDRIRSRLNAPSRGLEALPDSPVVAHIRAGEPRKKRFRKDVGADHRDLLRRYGDRGPLPRNIDRDEKMRAYEARYAAHGGKKGEKWQRRANVAEGVRNIALGTGTTALAGLAALKTKRGMAHVARHPHHQHRLDALALSSGAVGGGAELYGELARDRRASYASSPGGVAASALTRMRANTPGGSR